MNMKKVILIIIFFILFFNINAQTNNKVLYPNTYYGIQYQVQNIRTDYNSYYEYDQYGNKLNFEIWYSAKWYNYNIRHGDNIIVYRWIYFQNCNCYNWQQYYGHGVVYYFQWLRYKQYFYFYNGVKYYN